MGVTTEKGELGEAEVIADLTRQGHGVAIPLGNNLPFDLVLIRGDTGSLERVQVKYTTSNGRVVRIRCTSHSAWVAYQYRANQVDWIATFDATTAKVYYAHSCEWDGSTMVNLRLTPTINGQLAGIRWASSYQQPTCATCESRRGDSNPWPGDYESPALPTELPRPETK